jgi:hypothetical protein
MAIYAEMLEVFEAWRGTTQFPVPDDWAFASPVKLGRQPWSYDQVGATSCGPPPLLESAR